MAAVVQMLNLLDHCEESVLLPETAGYVCSERRLWDWTHIGMYNVGRQRWDFGDLDLDSHNLVLRL